MVRDPKSKRSIVGTLVPGTVDESDMIDALDGFLQGAIDDARAEGWDVGWDGPSGSGGG
jgi:hypothetical protein